MVNIPVLYGVPVGGAVTEGASGDEQHAGAAELVRKVVDRSSDALVEGVKGIASAMGPSLRAAMKSLSDIDVTEVSIGCSIDVNGSVVVAGMGAQANLTITFKVT